jgi:hypothetical protein
MLQRGYRPTLFKARCVLLAACIATGAPVLGSPVIDWNAFANNLPLGGPGTSTRGMAMTQIAVHDALNSIDPQYSTYTDIPPAAAGAAPDAAVAAASRVVLTALVPAQSAAITTYYNAQMSGCASQACLDGIQAGEAAANAILLRRNGDGSATPHLPYTLAAGPGVYQQTPPTPPAVTPNPPIQWAGWARVLPFALRSGSQFRADPSPMFDLTSAEYSRDYNEVKRVGALNAEALGNRTPQQSEVARFWPSGGGNWNAVLRAIVADRGLDEWQLARLFALDNIAQADAVVSVYDTKYTYNFWRPVTAIRYSGDDGNPATTPDPTWLSYQNTPPYPDYTCGMTTVAGAAVEVLRRYFGTDDIGYTLTTATGITRTFTSLSQATADVVDARVFGGMHFRTGCVRGVRQGEQVGHFAFQHELKPAKGADKRK